MYHFYKDIFYTHKRKGLRVVYVEDFDHDTFNNLKLEFRPFTLPEPQKIHGTDNPNAFKYLLEGREVSDTELSLRM
jgi:hypothetical protein